MPKQSDRDLICFARRLHSGRHEISVVGCFQDLQRWSKLPLSSYSGREERYKTRCLKGLQYDWNAERASAPSAYAICTWIRSRPSRSCAMFCFIQSLEAFSEHTKHAAYCLFASTRCIGRCSLAARSSVRPEAYPRNCYWTKVPNTVVTRSIRISFEQSHVLHCCYLSHYHLLIKSHPKPVPRYSSLSFSSMTKSQSNGHQPVTFVLLCSNIFKLGKMVGTFYFESVSNAEWLSTR